MMLAANHPTFTTSVEIKEIVKPLKRLGIAFFDYTRTDNDQGHTCLMTHPDIMQHYFEKKYYQIGNMEGNPSKYKSQVVLMSTLPNQHIYHDLLCSRNLDHGMMIIRPNDNDCEFFAFAANKENHAIVNTYLTKMDKFNNFIEHFREHAASLIKEVEKERIFYQYHENELDVLYNSLQDRDERSLAEFPRLSRRQLQIAKELLNGKTIPEISSELNLSPRTVEYYILNLRSKMKSKNKAELIVKLCKLFYST